MGSPRFKPTLETVEDRAVPATVTQAQAAFAYDIVMASHEELQVVQRHLKDPKTAETLAYHQVYLPQVSAVNTAMAQTLADYVGTLQAGIAADPSLASLYASDIQKATAGFQTANTNAAYSLAWGIGLGAPPPVAPVPPTVPLPTPAPPTALDPTDTSGMNRSFPDLASPQWRTTASGLRILDAVEGTGAEVAVNSTATVHYIGWLTDGTIFDSSTDSGDRPFEANLRNGVIQGWIEGVPGMKVGGIRRLDIPAALAYGEEARGSIPANSRLIFEIKALTPGTTTAVP